MNFAWRWPWTIRTSGHISKGHLLGTALSGRAPLSAMPVCFWSAFLLEVGNEELLPLPSEVLMNQGKERHYIKLRNDSWLQGAAWYWLLLLEIHWKIHEVTYGVGICFKTFQLLCPLPSALPPQEKEETIGRMSTIFNFVKRLSYMHLFYMCGYFHN